MTYQRGTGLISESYVVSAPLSFSGSAQRIWHITRNRESWAFAGMVTLALLFILLAWTFVLAWYLTWGLLLVPYRLIRRGQRKQRLADLRHQEMMNRTTVSPWVQ
jgi:hypothetical protein